MPAISGSMMVKEIRQDTYQVMLSLRAGRSERPKIVVGIQNVDVVLRAIGVPDEARAKVIDEVKTRRVGSSGRVQLSEDELKRLGLMWP